MCIYAHYTCIRIEESVAVLLVDVKDANKVVRVNITVAQSDLEAIDLAAAAAGMKRSAFLVQAGLGHSV